MTFKTIEDIIAEFDLESSEVIAIRKELKSLIKSLHPDSNGGQGFKDKISELTYNKLMSAIKFVDEQTLTITKSELSKTIKELIPTSDNKEEYVTMNNRINYEIRSFKKSNLLPKISASAIAIIVSFIWLFPATIAEHPLLSKIIEPTSKTFTIIWFSSLLLVGIVWLVTKRKEKLMKEALNKLNLEMIQNNIFLKAIRHKTYKAKKKEKDYIKFSKDEIIEFFSRIEIRGFEERFKYYKGKPIRRIKDFVNNLFGIEQLLDIEIAHSLADIIINRLLSASKISIIEEEGLSTNYRMKIKTTGNNDYN